MDAELQALYDRAERMFRAKFAEAMRQPPTPEDPEGIEVGGDRTLDFNEGGERGTIVIWPTFKDEDGRVLEEATVRVELRDAIPHRAAHERGVSTHGFMFKMTVGAHMLGAGFAMLFVDWEVPDWFIERGGRDRRAPMLAAHARRAQHRAEFLEHWAPRNPVWWDAAPGAEGDERRAEYARQREAYFREREAGAPPYAARAPMAVKRGRD